MTGKKLLVVDDDDAFREAMDLEFSERGWQVLTAPDHRTPSRHPAIQTGRQKDHTMNRMNTKRVRRARRKQGVRKEILGEEG